MGGRVYCALQKTPYVAGAEVWNAGQLKRPPHSSGNGNTKGGTPTTSKQEGIARVTYELCLQRTPLFTSIHPLVIE